MFKCYYAIETTFVSKGRTKAMFQEFEFFQTIGKVSSVGIKVGLAMVVVDLKTGIVIESEKCDIE